jgi:hypothetical protein
MTFKETKLIDSEIKWLLENEARGIGAMMDKSYKISIRQEECVLF